jgi:hypothetical protein
MARERYNAKHFYCHEQALSSREPTEAGMKTTLWNKYKHRVAYWGHIYDKLVADGGDISMYTRRARVHDERQPYIQDDLLDALHRNNCTSYRALSMYVNGWCALSTIEQWFKAHPTYLVYAKNIKPGLTEQNREKQGIFSKHVHSEQNREKQNRDYLQLQTKYFGFTATRNGFMLWCLEIMLKPVVS